MHDDNPAHGHTSRAQIAELLDERRVEVANAIVARMRQCDEVSVSPLIARTLVHALSQSITESSPDVVVHWSRMVGHAHPASIVQAMVETACEVAEELAHAEHADMATIVVFLEIVKARAATQSLDDVASSNADEPALQTAIQSLLAMLRARDDATCTHSRATGEWGGRIARRMGLGLNACERIVKAGILHDIGKIRVPDAILFKPSALAADEWEIMKRHAQSGADILSEIPALAEYAPIVGTHHERFDGRGYPFGLAGDEILLESRVVSVADSFHAMVSDRPYRRALTYGEAIAALTDGRGRQWDADVTDVMIALAAEERNTSTDADLVAMSTSFFGDAPLIQLPGSLRAI